MAKQTDIRLRNQVIYSMFVRNHTKEGTFRAAEADLERIKGLGVDILWLLPIHPIGEVRRKGTLGSPYAIQDYRKINPEYGTMEDFVHFVDKVHANGMQCMIDVVYNHTSPDSWLAENHPEFFYKKPDGNMGNKVGDWQDVVDLDYGCRDLWDYQIETLCKWAGIVDGFRCDVAPLVPMSFWKAARKAVEEVHPGFVWLSESVEPGFIRELRGQGFVAHSDGEVYKAFDITYDYEIEGARAAYLDGRIGLREYVGVLNFQNTMYPANYVKLRFLENHDQTRGAFKFPNESDLINWTAFNYFQKGAALLYGGEEKEASHKPSLFDKDDVEWETGKDISGLLKKLYEIKKDVLLAEGDYSLECDEASQIVTGLYVKGDAKLYGAFSLRSRAAYVKTDVADGDYTDLIGGGTVTVKNGRFWCDASPVIFRA